MISIEKCADYSPENVRAALDRTFDHLGGINKYIKPGMRVVLKPNLVRKKHPRDAATTHPALVRILSEMIYGIVSRKEGGSVVIAESPGGPYSERMLKGVYSACQMDQAVEGTGAVLNFDIGEVEVENPDGKYLKGVTIIKPIAEADFVINLPKLKTHGQMAYTGAVKNMFGAVPGILKAEYHFKMPDYSEFANAIIDIFLSAKPGLNIMDAVAGMDGAGPTAGTPRKIGAILAGENAFALDFTALTMVGADPYHVPVIREAVQRKLCPAGLEEIDMKGCAIEEFAVADFKMPQLETLRTLEFFENSIFRFITRKLRPKPVFIHALCIGCAECKNSCPADIIKIRDGKPYADLSGCIRCFCCQELCPAKAVTIKRSGIVNLFIKLSRKV